MRILIIANGSPVSQELVRRLSAESDRVVLTDGAANHWNPYLPAPDFVLGDFDSIQPVHLATLTKTQRIDAPDQHASDLEKAIQFAISIGAKAISIAGWEGDRQDHMLTAVSLLLQYEATCRVRLVSQNAELYSVIKRLKISGSVGDTLSLIAFSLVQDLTLTGVKWPLEKATLAPGSSGVSNIFEKSTVSISLSSGSLIVVHTRN